MSQDKNNSLSNLPAKDFFQHDKVMAKFEKVLNENASGFVTSVLQVVNQNKMLANADPVSIMGAALTAASMGLPINPNLGFAYIIPYNSRSGVQAQFQMGYKGFIQLAQRSGLYKTISTTEVYEGQLVNEDPLKGFEFNWNAKQSDTIIGYAAYFELLNGFQKILYMSRNDVEAHAKKYSQSYGKKSSPWTDLFDEMAKKTVLKLLLSKYGPMSVEMQRAHITDQSIVKDPDSMEVEYPDNQKITDPSQAESMSFENHPEEIDPVLQQSAPEHFDFDGDVEGTPFETN